ncbi:myeloid-associated differentiation marker-like isoform X3 [Passer montanus]|uniref:myeloid-associated differentiation marker-like isoform X3 n=1 Tax=Passer montanus TaxID=9160 RepID=UPI0019619216|nr:myeloid-associated differentiation marker-like isoform X3 [Passer montanus]
MATVNLRALTSWVGIARLLALVLSCLTFSLVASTGDFAGPYGTWCMFTWCFCFAVTLLVLLLELLELYPLLPLSWDDFTSAFSMLAALMVFTSSVVFPAIFIDSSCSGSHCARQAVATAASCLCFLAYATEVSLTRAKPGDISSFLSTVPGLLKVFETYVACLIFSLLQDNYKESGLMWCLAVYSICFIFTLLIIIFTIGRCLTYIPCSLEKGQEPPRSLRHGLPVEQAPGGHLPHHLQPHRLLGGPGLLHQDGFFQGTSLRAVARAGGGGTWLVPVPVPVPVPVRGCRRS